MDVISRPRTSPPEMLEKPHLHETFFSLKGVQERPMSVATEFMESDYDDDEILSDNEECENSPRLSMNSSGQPSITTLSSYEGPQTPRSSRAQTAFQVDIAKQIEGPRGPHMFRSSLISANSIEYQNALSLSPITPKVANPFGTEFTLPIALDLTPLPSARLRRTSGPFKFTEHELDTCFLSEWSPEMVAQWMFNAGIELPIAEKFVENDINGAILITLRFEDLKELGIPSFGVRTKVWEEIHKMRDINPEDPMPETPIEDVPDHAVMREQRKEDDEALGKPKRGPSSRRRKQPGLEDIISPLESVSIVGIEQMMPKPHNCSKGENCAKWKRNQRMIEAFKNDHPFVDMDKGGVIMLAGDPGNAATTTAIPREDIFRPMSDAIPSVVASSDIMGTGALPPLQYLQEASLRNIQARDPQDNVRQFLHFQKTESVDAVPPTPPFEITPHQGLRGLPRLAIPRSATAPPRNAAPLSALPTPAHAYQPYIPIISSNLSAEPETVSIAIESSPEETPTAPYRFGTPFSDMDVPVTFQPTGPIARDTSQSVPPDMNYRHAPRRSMSRASSRRPSFPVMPALDENRVAALPQQQRAQTSPLRRMQPPPRVKYPWTPAAKTYETALAPIRAPQPTGSQSSASSATTASSSGIATFTPSTAPSSTSGSVKDAEGVTYAGPMRKRRTRMLRHEWNEHFCTLKGSRLAVHPADSAARAKTLEYIDVDDYAILCSSSVATSKLSAAFKAMNIKRESTKQDAGAFAFQLVPQDQRGGVKLRKRESALPFGMGEKKKNQEEESEGVNGTGKAHHFAVKGRDDRIEWMRELMLAKAMKQKGEGFEVSVNGNMI